MILKEKSRKFEEIKRFWLRLKWRGRVERKMKNGLEILCFEMREIKILKLVATHQLTIEAKMPKLPTIQKLTIDYYMLQRSTIRVG